MSRVVVVGAGAAGMMAAIAAAELSHKVILYEKNEKAGKKLYITGKGRCNLTNACDVTDLFKNIVTNSKFMYTPIYCFDNSMVMDFFEQNGCRLKTERGQRVFPESDKASDVINTLYNAMKQLGVEIHFNSPVTDVVVRDQKVCGVMVQGKIVPADSVIIATGGYSYPSTGSTGDGHNIAKKLGHRVTRCVPALVPFITKEEWVKELQGLSLRNCGVRVMDGTRQVYEDFGELLFTHFGVSGPTVLSASSYVADIIKNRELKLIIDLKPAMDVTQLDARILRDFEKNINRSFSNSLDELFPKSLIPVMIHRTGIDPDKKVNGITKQERARLLKLTKEFDMTLVGLRGFNEAIITHGGIDVRDVDPHTMESTIIKKLYFAGEILDVDAVTGGFNLQVAWSSGHLAGISQE